MGRVSGVLVVCVVAGCGGVDTASTAQAVGSPTTIVSLTFDDTLADQAQVADMAAARGMRVTFFINSPRVDHTGYMALADLLAFQAVGHEIGGHTISHADLPTLDLDEAKRQVCNDRVALLADGFAVRTFAYPFGDNNALVDQIVADCGYNSARDVGGLPSNGSCQGCPFANTVPPQNLMAVRTPDSIKIDTTLDEIEGYVLQAEQHGGGWVPLVFHHVCDGCNSLSVSPATLAAFLDWLAARSANGTVVETMGDVIGGPVQPGVEGPPPGETAPGIVLQNPSLEIDANNDQIPDCWQRGGSGTNTATYSYESPGYDGAIAQRIDVTALTSGARRLVIKQDLGQCAPTAYPGHSYLVSAFYKSDTQPHFSVYYRDSTGSWVFLAQGPALPASPTYVRGTYTTPPYPAGTTAISVGLSILAVGSLTMDEFTLVDTDVTSPTVDFATPADGATVSGTVDIPITASDAGGVATVEVLINGAATTVAGPPYTYHWDTTQIADSVVGVAVRATDLAGNVSVTPSHLVTIANAPVDTTPPTVALTDPHDGAAVRGTISLAATASDDVAVQLVEFFVDDVSVGSANAAPYAVAWSSASHADGAAVVTARATDAAGNSTTSTPVTIAIDNTAPGVSITDPIDGASVRGTIALAATANDAAVQRVEFFVDGVSVGFADTAPYAIAWSSASHLDGIAAITARATDRAGNATTSTPVAVIVDNTPPSVALVTPVDGAAVGGTIAIAATAVDADVQRVDFFVDGAPAGSAAAAPYAVAWPSASHADGAAVVTAVAIDRAGNTAISAPVTIAIDNTPPTTAVACNGAPCGGYYAGDVTVTLAAADAGSGVAAIRYSLDGSAPGTLYTGPFAVTSSATLLVSAQDAVGNIELASATAIAIDRGAPIVSIACDGGACSSALTNRATEVSLTATAGASGVAQILYTLDGSDPAAGLVYTGPFVVTTTTTVRFMAISGASVPSDVGSQLLRIDTSPPTAAILSPRDGDRVTGVIMIIAAAADDNRVVRVRFLLDGTQIGAVGAPPYEWKWSSSKAGAGPHVLTVIAEDAAGNATTSPAVTVIVRH